MARNMSRRSRFGLSGSAEPSRRRCRSQPGLGRLARLRSLRLEPLEERTLLSVDLTYMHIIYNPTNDAAAIASSSSADAAAGYRSAGLPVARRVHARANSRRVRDRLDQPWRASRDRRRPDHCHRQRLRRSGPGQQHELQLRQQRLAPVRRAVRHCPIRPVSRSSMSTAARTTRAADTTGWAVEEALDVEWAHALAPQANIILFEAQRTSDADLITTRWGTLATSSNLSGRVRGFHELRPRARTSSDTSEEPSFTTPAGHTGRDVPGLHGRQRLARAVFRPFRPTSWPSAARP